MRVCKNLSNPAFLKDKINKISKVETRLINNLINFNYRSFNTLNKIDINFENNKKKSRTLSATSKKHFFDILGKHNVSKIEFQNKVNTEDTYFVPKEKLKFKKNKLQITKIPGSFLYRMRILQSKGLFSVWALSIFFTGDALLRFNIIQFVFSSVALYYFSRMNYAFNQNRSLIITNLYLLENGKEVEIETVDTSVVTDIKNIREISYEEALNTLDLINKARKRYLPLAINGKLYLFRLESDIYYEDIFSAIKSGKYIQTNIHDDVNKTK